MASAPNNAPVSERRVLSWLALVFLLIGAGGFGLSLTPWTAVGYAAVVGLIAVAVGGWNVGSALQHHRRVPARVVIPTGAIIVVMAVVAMIVAGSGRTEFGSPGWPGVALLGGLGTLAVGLTARATRVN